MDLYDIPARFNAIKDLIDELESDLTGFRIDHYSERLQNNIDMFKHDLKNVQRFMQEAHEDLVSELEDHMEQWKQPAKWRFDAKKTEEATQKLVEETMIRR